MAYLYSFGGYYFDVDLQVIEGERIFEVAPDVSFATVKSFVHPAAAGEAPSRGQFFHAFLASKPKSPILEKALRVMEAYYTGGFELRAGEWMGRATLFHAFHLVPAAERDKVYLLEEIKAGREMYPLIPLHNWLFTPELQRQPRGQWRI